jgi:NAD(P)-dependent dehydrogenase (short-subunit alcohol dehydrogenase family)
MAQFDGKVAFVTGGGSGIGRETALLFAKDGAKVMVADVVPQGAEDTVRMIRDGGGAGEFVIGDVSNSQDIQRMVAATVEKLGRLDYAVNNAGIGGEQNPVAAMSEQGWSKVIAINLTGVFLGMKYEIPEILKAGGGAIVNTASILGTVAFANSAAYVAAKHGVVGLTQTAALEYATQGIRINSIGPGFIYTPLVSSAGFTEGSDVYNYIAGLHPMKRFGRPEEIGEAIVWLCSEKASFVTGHQMLVDGGYTAQ